MKDYSYLASHNISFYIESPESLSEDEVKEQYKEMLEEWFMQGVELNPDDIKVELEEAPELLNRKTASTRHILDLVVSVDGDEGVENEHLHFAIIKALKANDIEVLALTITEDIGLGAEGATLVHDWTSADPTLLALNEITLLSADGEVMLDF